MLGAIAIFAIGEGTEAFLGDLLKTVGPTGFVVWFCYYTVTKTLPAKDAEHRQEVELLTKRLDRLAESIDGMVAHCRETTRIRIDAPPQTITGTGTNIQG